MTSSATAPQTRWEYHSVTRVSEAAMVEALNQFGQESWELVSAAHYRDMAGMMAWTAILKRPIRDGSAQPVRQEAPAARMAAPSAVKATSNASVEGGEDTAFELIPPVARPPRPASRPTKLAPAKPRVEIADDFDFELADSVPAVQKAARATKAKPAVAEEDFDFELGDTFPTKLQPPKPAAVQPKAEGGSDDTDFDLG